MLIQALSMVFDGKSKTISVSKM